MPFRTAVFAAAALLLGGCQTVFNAVGVAIPLSAGETRVFDGSYQGRIRTVAATGPLCPQEPGERVLMVGDGVLWYAYNPRVLFATPVLYDGSVNDQAGDTRMMGRITGNHLQATVESPSCKTEISMNFIYNH